MQEVSVIIPVYNTSKYLRECLDDICAQSFTDWECLLIDDGSTDDSGYICDEYAEKDSRFKTFHIKNGGASCARNYGIGNSCGEWIAFVDSDDKVSPDYLKNLISAVDSNRTDVVLSNYGGRQIDMHIRENCRLEGERMIDYFLKNKLFALSAPYGKLYKRSIIADHNILFPQGIHMGEDMVFMINYMNHVDSASLIIDCSYFVNRVEGSLSTRYYSFESEYKCFELWKNGIELFVNKSNVHLENIDSLIWNNRTGRAFLRCCECMYLSKQMYSSKEKLSNLRSLNKVDCKQFQIYYNHSGFKSKVIKFLIGNRLLFFYNVIASLFAINKRLPFGIPERI